MTTGIWLWAYQKAKQKKESLKKQSSKQSNLAAAIYDLPIGGLSNLSSRTAFKRAD